MDKQRVNFKNRKVKKNKDKKLLKISAKNLSMILFTIGLLIFFLSIYKGDKYWKFLHNYLHGLFGWCAVLLGPGLIYIAAIIITGKIQKFTKIKLLQSVILILMLCSFIQMKIYDISNIRNEDIANIDLFFEAGTNHKGGGLIVGLITWVLINNLGLMSSKIFISIIIFAFFMFIFDITLIDLRNCIKKIAKLINKLITKTINKQSAVIDGNTLIEEKNSVNDYKKSSIYENAPELSDFVDLYDDTHLICIKDEKYIGKQENFSFEDVSEFQTIFDDELTSDIMSSKINDCLCDDAAIEESNYLTPNIACLDMPCPINKGNLDEELKSTASKLIKTLRNFGVIATILDVSRGPSVTRYEVQPSVGVKVNKITGLADDIALNLATSNVRIEAPIPNKAVVGIEVPNKKVSIVNIREIINSQEFKDNKSNLTIALGKDITGNFVIVDISKMSHVLIAGSTGSGKSVCINSIIISLIYKSSPEDVKLLMIDPKVVELGIYEGIPHLLVQVVTDREKAADALNKVVNEMYKRYEKFAKKFVRNINDYNKLMEAEGSKKLYKIVVIVDELADLMTNDVENLICKLAQMARAAGIHLIIATQRPSVNVITGVIKANIPSRIAFAVSSHIDSRTIIDSAGAEKLLGKGDMLFWPAGENKPLRIQGCFVSSEEVKKVVGSFNLKFSANSFI